MIVLLLLTACAPELVATWQGACVFLDPTPHELAVDLDILRARGGDLEGIGSFVVPTADRGWTFEGNLVGDHTDDEVILRLDGEGGGYLMTLRVEGQLRHHDIDGVCTLDDQHPDVEGEITLSPVDD